MKDFEFAKDRSNPKKNLWYRVKIKSYEFLSLFPVINVKLMDKAKDAIYNRFTWNEEIAVKVLDYALPKSLEYMESEHGDYYYYSTAWASDSLLKNVPLLRRKWAEKFYFQLIMFLCETYQKDGYDKRIYSDDGTYIEFTKIE